MKGNALATNITLVFLVLGLAIAGLSGLHLHIPMITQGAGWGAAIAVVLLVVPGINAPILRVIKLLANLDAKKRVYGAAVAGVSSILILTLVDYWHGRVWMMVWHDEFQFHLQSQLLAHFKLWLPAHPLGDFFDTFYVLTSGVYAPQSFPGASLMFVPTVWFGLPVWLMPLVVTGVTCGLIWWILSELIDASSATLGLIILLCTFGFQRIATMYMAQMPLLMLGLFSIVGMMRWRQTGGIGWAILIGASLGWAAITRPLDAVAFGVIVLIGILPRLIKTPTRKLAATISLIIASALPFLALQITFNLGVTGSALQTPFDLYNQIDQPALAYGGSGDLSVRPRSSIPQKQWFYDTFTLKFVRFHNDPNLTTLEMWRNRLPVMLPMLAPVITLLPLLAVGMLGLKSRERFLVFALLPLFVLAYQFYPIFLFHYVLMAIPAVMLLYALVPPVIEKCVTVRQGRFARSTALTVMAGISIGAMIDRSRYELPDERKAERMAIDQTLTQVRPPAIVLFTPPSDPESLHLEVVYNDNVSWPDDAPIIRAHDRGALNINLYRYYANIAPNRVVWRFDRPTMKLEKIGTVRELASQGQTQ